MSNLETIIGILLMLCCGAAVGAGILRHYYAGAIALYETAKSGNKAVLLVSQDNPKLMEAGLLLHQGEMSLKYEKLSQGPERHLEVVKDD